ncbi:Prephenate dehydratase-domain-containing protein [Achaetomium macrosporum]|uniref:Prephenate dehydratase-domain-containing protein n=1 Tax=Achaetomium macrosporum TaxID=79813 RepID=A0AAN7CDD2_9PEZI|nr:Prephenate dehydratase-domain-containing protein [Achaetomium macrosporum]
MATTGASQDSGQEDGNSNRTVAFLGPLNSYSHRATKIAFFEETWRLEPTGTIKEVFDWVQSSRAAYGVVPFENSTHGTVTFTLDSLADRAGEYANVVVCDEVYLDVHHFLLGRLPPPPSSPSSSSVSAPVPAGEEEEEEEPKKGVPLTSLSHIRRVYSHPQAFGQTGAFRHRYLRHAETIDVSSTSRAAELAAADPAGTSAAIASEWAGKAAGLDVLARCVEDREDNTTRFFVLRRREGREDDEQERAGPKGDKGGGDGDPAYEGGKYKSLVSFTVPHRRAGALADVLDCFRARALNLTSISSVPSLDAPFQYLFFVEFEGSRYDDPEGRVSGVLGDLERVAERWRWLGSWQSGRLRERGRERLEMFFLFPRLRRPHLTPNCLRHSQTIITNQTTPYSSLSSSASTFNPEAYLLSAQSKFASQPPTLIPDILSPTPSHLLTLSLADHIPSLFPQNHAINSRLPSTLASSAEDLVLPQGHHMVYFPLQLPPSKLMPDGTDPAHCPGSPFERRMWAGGEVVFHPGWERAMRVDGRRAVCVESVGTQPVLKQDKVFVEVRRLYGVGERDENNGRELMRDEEIARKVVEGGGGAVIEEVRRLVFMRRREGGGETKEVVRRAVKASATPEFVLSLKPDATLLFHFSALTYNAHAIHLNPDYCRNREGYKGLLVHGPLSMVLMLSALRGCLARFRSQVRTAGPTAAAKSSTPEEEQPWMPYIKSLNYRNLAPLYANEDMRVCLRRTKAEGSGLEWDVWVEGPDGGLAVKGHAVTTDVVQAA